MFHVKSLRLHRHMVLTIQVLAAVVTVIIIFVIIAKFLPRGRTHGNVIFVTFLWVQGGMPQLQKRRGWKAMSQTLVSFETSFTFLIKHAQEVEKERDNTLLSSEFARHQTFVEEIFSNRRLLSGNQSKDTFCKTKPLLCARYCSRHWECTGELERPSRNFHSSGWFNHLLLSPYIS